MDNQRDCEHGRQKGKCCECDLEKADQLLAECAELLDEATLAFDPLDYIRMEMEDMIKKIKGD